MTDVMHHSFVLTGHGDQKTQPGHGDQKTQPVSKKTVYVSRDTTPERARARESCSSSTYAWQERGALRTRQTVPVSSGMSDHYRSRHRTQWAMAMTTG